MGIPGDDHPCCASNIRLCTNSNRPLPDHFPATASPSPDGVAEVYEAGGVTVGQ